MKATLIAALVLVLFPTRLGEPMPQARSDAAHFIGYQIDPREYVQHRASRSGWTGSEWRCLHRLIYRESRWRLDAKNPHSSARGLFQVLGQPAGQPLEVQTRIGLTYIKERYGTPCAALKHHLRRNWY